MLRTIGILALLTSAAYGVTSTTVTDTIMSPFGSGLFNGTIAVSCSRAQTSVGGVVAGATSYVTVTSGVFSITITPYTTSSPSTPCSVTYSSTDALGNPLSSFERWVIPPTTRVLTIADVLVRAGNPLPLCPSCVVTTGLYPNPPWITYMAFDKLATGTLDASAATATSPFKIGTALPASCSVGQSFFKTNASAGSNIYGCTATNTWTLEGGGGGGTPAFSNVTSGSNTTATMVIDTGASLSYTNSGIVNANKILGAIITGITGVVWMDAGVPRTASPGTDVSTPTASETTVGNRTFTGSINASGATHTIPAKVGLAASKPATCTVGEMYFATDATAGQNWYFCASLNTWTQQLNSGGGGGSGTVTVVGSGSLTSTALVTGGGTTTLQTPSSTATMDASGNIVTPGTITTGSGTGAAGTLDFTQGTAPTVGTTAITLHAPSSVTSYRLILPGTSATGFLYGSNSANVNTLSFVGSVGSGTSVVKATAVSGNSTTVANTSGTLTSGNCAKFDASGNIVDNGAACGGGSGSSIGTIDLSLGGQSSGILTGPWDIGGGNAISAGSYWKGISYSSSGTPSYTATFRIPYDFNVASTVYVLVTAGNGNGVTGAIRFKATLGCFVNGQSTYSDATYGTTLTIGTITISGANTGSSSALTSGLDVSACSAGALARLVLSRDNTVGSNLADDVAMMGLVIKYTRM